MDIKNIQNQVHNEFGFTVDSSKTPFHNACLAISHMPLWLFNQKITQPAFHNHSDELLPPSVRYLLGLNLKFIPSPTNIASTQNLTDIPRFHRQLKLYYIFGRRYNPHQKPPDDENPKLILPSTWTPPNLPTFLADRFTHFSTTVSRINESIPQPPSNLLPIQKAGLRFLKNRPDLLVWPTDKNLGPIVTTKQHYVELIIRDHLSDTKTYKKLHITLAQMHIRYNVIPQLKKFVNQHLSTTPQHPNNPTRPTKNGLFVLHGTTKLDSPFAHFYATAKVHKKPMKTRPIVSVNGSLLEHLGKYLDVQLQKIIKILPWIIRSTTFFLQDIRQHNFPPTVRLFTADAISMYTNIDTNHALQVISSFLRSDHFIQLKCQHNLQIKTETVIDGLAILMKNNLFTFNGEVYHQLTGTAMGTAPAPAYATLYFWIHENMILAPFLQGPLYFYGRYIDDIVGAWNITNSLDTWTHFKEQMNTFGSLRWEFSELSNTVDFLDTRLSIHEGKLSTCMFEKELNLHLYLPASSSHPPGALYSLVVGMLLRINFICSNDTDKKNFSTKFAQRLLHRGYSVQQLRYAWRKASLAITEQNKPKHSNCLRPIILHTTYTPSCHYKMIKKAYTSIIEKPPGKIPLSECAISNKSDAFGPSHIILAHHRTKNLKNILAPRSLLSNPFNQSI